MLSLFQTNSSYYVRWLFLKCMAAIYLIAFASLSVQIMGLIGSQGILPAKDYLELVARNVDSSHFGSLPTVFWFNCSDQMLQAICWAGIICSLLAFFGLAQGILFFLMWAMYLSLFHVGQDFLGFQWDILLLEVGFLCVFFAPWRFWVKNIFEDPPSRIVLYLLWWVLFRLMFQSGLVKLLSGDESWTNLTALNYHFMTQPIPNPVSWFMHWLPGWVLKCSTFIMFSIEFGCPVLILFGRWGRMAACLGISGLMIIVILTGNYCFFNLLVLALCLLLLNDALVKKILSKKFLSRQEVSAPSASLNRVIWWTKQGMIICVALIIILISAINFNNRWAAPRSSPGPIALLMKYAGPFALTNSYGLFAVMTKTRPEIILEGSNDGRVWQAYEFKWKIGDLKRRPPQVAAHQPRLDWQMWFAAMGSNYQHSPWTVSLMQKLLEGSKPVVDLLGTNPFPDQPPKLVRALIYEYKFTDAKTRRETGQWWERKLLGLFCPPLYLNKK